MANDILNNLIVLRINKTTYEEVLKDLSEAAVDAGYAKPGYYQAIIERERKYPTGLHIPNIEVAIPHADAEWALKSSVSIGILENPVIFKPMGGEGGDVHAGLVFMLTIQDPKEHINFLRAFSNLMGQRSEMLLEFARTANPEPIIEILRAGIPDRA